MDTENKEGMETESEVLETVVPQVTETKPPTTEAKEATLQAEISDLKQRLEQTDKGLRSAQSTLTQKDRLLKEKEDLRSEITLLKDMVKVLAVSRRNEDDTYDLEESAKKKPSDVDARFQRLEQEHKERITKLEQARLAQDMNAKIGEYQARTETLKLDENSEEYLDIKDMVLAGKFQRAEIKLAKLEAAMKEKTAETKPTETKTEVRKETDDEV